MQNTTLGSSPHSLTPRYPSLVLVRPAGVGQVGSRFLGPLVWPGSRVPTLPQAKQSPLPSWPGTATPASALPFSSRPGRPEAHLSKSLDSVDSRAMLAVERADRCGGGGIWQMVQGQGSPAQC